MIDETVTIKVFSEPGAISELTLRPSSGQHGTIALNLFAIYLETAWTTRLYVNFINRINYFFRRSVFHRMLLTYNFFWPRHHLRFSLRLSLSWGILKYGYVWFERVRDESHWKSKKPLQKNVKISFFNIGNILLFYLSVSNTTYFDILKYLAKGWCRQIILTDTSIDIGLNIQWGTS